MPKFSDYPDFTPNLTPRQIFSAGSFIDQGGYWRPVYSDVLSKRLTEQHKEFDFFNTIPEHLLINDEKDYKKYNKYGVKCGSSLKFWEDKGWIHPQDPYGWVQWYCRFYKGRRTEDDERQIKRWKNLAGEKGRFRRQLINKIKKEGKKYDDVTISPVVRQTLLHWAYELTEHDFNNG